MIHSVIIITYPRKFGGAQLHNIRAAGVCIYQFGSVCFFFNAAAIEYNRVCVCVCVWQIYIK